MAHRPPLSEVPIFGPGPGKIHGSGAGVGGTGPLAQIGAALDGSAFDVNVDFDPHAFAAAIAAGPRTSHQRGKQATRAQVIARHKWRAGARERARGRGQGKRTQALPSG
jgi:hypothetical protein